MSKAIPEPVTQLIDAFAALPGIGPKTASRLTYFLLRAPEKLSANLSEALRDLKSKTRLCSQCYNITVDDPCPICADSKRDKRTIAVVEEPLDALAIERTGAFNGVFHVLHGAISPVQGIGPDDLKIRELVRRTDDSVLEIIIATNPGMEGDATAMFITRELQAKGVKISRLARGLPTGGDLEYVDTITLLRALQGRNSV